MGGEEMINNPKPFVVSQEEITAASKDPLYKAGITVLIRHGIIVCKEVKE